MYNLEQLLFVTVVTIFLVFTVYNHAGWKNIIDCYGMWFTKKYWTNYNIIEALSWFSKVIIIVPGLVFNIHIWQLYFVALVTSLLLIWVSNKKLLPTLVAFNTLWVWLSLMVISKNLF